VSSRHPQRSSTKHNPRLDEELEREAESIVRGAPVESRVDESRLKEDAGEGEFGPAGRPAPPGELGTDDIDARREISRHLRPSAFPGDREALLAEAAQNHAPAEVVAALNRLQPGIEYATVHEVWVAIVDPELALRGREALRRAASREPLSEADE
jgi:hypothetical protein